MASSSEQVKTLVIKKDGEEFSLTHEGAEWVIDGDPAAQADSGRVNMFLTRALQLQAERVVTDTPGDLKPYGLAPPATELTVMDLHGKMLGRLTVGRVENNLAFAQGSALPGVFLIRPDILKDIPKRSDITRPVAP
jgi:hypothetical protein